MPILQIRNLPQEIYNLLKESADISRRSLNQEAIVLLEKGLAIARSERLNSKNKMLFQLLNDEDRPVISSEDATEWIRNDRDSK